MNTTHVLGATVLLSAMIATAGCSTTTETTTALPARTGFLSTYRNLEPSSSVKFSYLAPDNRLVRYDKFIIDPVEFRLHDGSELTEEDRETIQTYMHDSLAAALSNRYQIVSTPSWDTAEIRIAVTNVRKSAPILNAIPRPKVIDLGLGGLSMEGEIVDSVSKVQLAAMVDSRIGQNRTIDFTQLDDTKAVMDDWAWHFANVFDQAHEFAVAQK